MKTSLAGEATPIQAWSPDGKELWFASSRRDDGALNAVDLNGRVRAVTVFPNLGRVSDVSRDGRILMVVGRTMSGIRCLPPGEAAERDLSLFSGLNWLELSRDGRTLLFSDRGAGGEIWTYLRKTDGSANAVRLGEG